MPRTYNESLVKCPFFIGEGIKSITCEGIVDECVLRTIFREKTQREIQRYIFCDDRYTNCEIYRMLEAKYEE